MIAVLVVILLAFPNIAQAATKYVSPSGSALWSNCNTSGTPCSVATGLANAVAGDVVRFVSGDYFPPNAPNYYQPAWRPTNSGTAGNPITLISDVRHGAVIHDAANADNVGEGRSAFGVYQNSYVTIDGFRFESDILSARSTNEDVRYTVAIDSSNNIHFQNCLMTGWEHSDHTNASLIGVYGQTTNSYDIYIHHNDLSGIMWDSTSPIEAMVNASSVYIFEAHHVYVYNNTIHDANNGVSWKTEPNDIHVYQNYLYNIHRSAFFPTIEVSAGNSNHYVHHNVCRNCNIFLDAEESPSGGGTWSNLQVYNNTMHNESSWSFGRVPNTSGGYSNVSGMIMGQDGGAQTARDVQFYNNIFSLNTTSRGWEIHDDLTSDAMLGAPFDYNVYYISSGTLQYIYNGTNTTSFATWQSAIGGDGEEANSSTSNPVFINGSGNMNVVTDFQLNPSTSPFLANGYGGVQRGAFEGGGCVGAVCEEGGSSSGSHPNGGKKMAPMINLRRGS